jgi:Rhs element Vgr protein
MANSPLQGAEGVVTVSITSDGSALADSVEIVSVEVSRTANAIPVARIVLNDGDIANQTFPLSAASTFKPGAEITISAGYAATTNVIFSGIVIRHGIKITGQNDCRLVVECRDKAVAMTIGRKNANFVDKTDSAIITALIGAHAGLTADVESTSETFKELVQYYCTDWDFMLARAEANGHLVIAVDGKVTVKAPAASATPDLSVSYGVDLIEFHGDIDARTQFASVETTAWDPKTLAVVEQEAGPATLNTQGDLDSAALAAVVGLAKYQLQSAVPLSAGALTGWAKAQQVKSGLARVQGRMKFQGNHLAGVGTLVKLAGVGPRFSGNVFVGAVRHDIADGEWTTEVSFGLPAQWITERADVMAPAASGWLPGVGGLQVGIVMKLDEDPESQQRIQVSVPVMKASTEGVWARLASFYGSSSFGAFFVPEIGDEVVLGYFNDDPSHPVILGSLYSSKHVPPYVLTAENNTKAIVTRSKTRIEFDDDKKVITITTPGTNKIVLSDDGKSILVQDQNSNKVELGTGGITLDSPKDIKISAKGAITIDAVGAISIASKADVKTTGLNVNSEAQVGFVAKGAATAELSASGQTTVKGAMVMIN